MLGVLLGEAATLASARDPRRGRCSVCGALVRDHFDSKNRKVVCRSAAVGETVMVSEFPRRVARQDFLRLAERGGDYTVHAAAGQKQAGLTRTACGRNMRFAQDLDESTLVSCRNCLAHLTSNTLSRIVSRITR